MRVETVFRDKLAVSALLDYLSYSAKIGKRSLGGARLRAFRFGCRRSKT